MTWPELSCGTWDFTWDLPIITLDLTQNSKIKTWNLQNGDLEHVSQKWDHVWAAFESKSQIENIIGTVELDFHNGKLGLMVWLAKLASVCVFGYHGNYCS